MKRILYSGSVHDQDEKDAVMAVLDGGVSSFALGENVAGMERSVAALFGKASGVMVNSGSSALYLAVELLNLPPGSEVITSTCTFSTDISSLVRAGLVPVFVDIEADTFNADVRKIEELVTPKTRAILLPNLIGNAPRLGRGASDRRSPRPAGGRGFVRRARRTRFAARQPALVPTSASPASPTRTSSPARAMAAWCCSTTRTCAIAACCCAAGAVAPRCSSTARRTGERDFWEEVDGVRYDNMFIFDELGWNFEPSEMGAAFGIEQLKKLPRNYERRQRNFALYNEFFAKHVDRIVLPRQTAELDTAWLCYPIIVRPDAGFKRSDIQLFLEQREVDTRTVWTGNAVRQPMMKNVTYRAPVRRHAQRRPRDDGWHDPAR